MLLPLWSLFQQQPYYWVSDSHDSGKDRHKKKKRVEEVAQPTIKDRLNAAFGVSVDISTVSVDNLTQLEKIESNQFDFDQDDEEALFLLL